jgi:UDP-sulfoquinovose synthase
VEQGLLDEVVNIAGKYQDRCDRSKVLPSSFWSKARAQAATSDTARVEERSQ